MSIRKWVDLLGCAKLWQQCVRQDQAAHKLECHCCNFGGNQRLHKLHVLDCCGYVYMSVVSPFGNHTPGSSSTTSSS